MSFPTITGKNLEDKKLTIPNELEGEFNFLIIAFQRWHQQLVDTWTPFLKDITEQNQNSKFYELPTISSKFKDQRPYIDRGMRAGIRSREIRERTITLYLDKEDLKKHLEVQSEETIFTFLIDRSGKIYWRGIGQYKPEYKLQLDRILNFN